MTKRATDDLNLRAAFPEMPQDCRDALLRAARSVKEDKKLTMKRMPVRVAVIAALILALTMTAAAAAVALGLNPFELFSDRRPEYGEIADQTAIEPALPVTWTDERAGTTVVNCAYAYYDGSSLLLGCTILNDTYVEEWTPTDAEKNAMQPLGANLWPVEETELEVDVLLRLQQAMEQGDPLGWAKYQVYFSDHSYAADGTDLGRSGGEEQRLDGTLATIRDYWELPRNLWEQSEITVRIPVRQTVQRYYFDGQALYTLMDRRELEPLTVTVPRTEADLRRCTGETEIRGVQARVSVMATAVRLFVTVKLADEMPRAENEQPWCDLNLYDENGDMLITNSCHWRDDTCVFFTVDGTGHLPEELTGSFVVGVPSPTGEDQTEEYPLHLRPMKESGSFR